MSKTFKRVIALLLTLSMVMMVMAGCGDTPTESNDNPVVSGDAPAGNVPANGDANSNSDEVVTLNVYSQLANYSGTLGGWAGTLLKDKFGVELVIIPESDGTYQTRVESGDLGDIVVWGSNDANYQNAINKGLLLDWNEDDLLATHGPYIKEVYGRALDANAAINPDGLVHGFGHNFGTDATNHEAFFYTWDIRWDLYKQLGYPEVKNLDDLVEVLAQMQQLNPTDDNGNPVYAASPWPDWDGDMVMYVKSTAQNITGYDEMGLGLYDSVTGDYHDVLETNGPYYQALKFYNKLYQRGLLDPDSMTQNYNQMMAKVTSGGVLFSIFDYAGSGLFNTDEHKAAGKYMASLQPTDTTNICYGLSLDGGIRVWSIGEYTEYPEKCMDLINWLATPEGAMTSWYGIKGLMWDYDENGHTYFTDLGLKCHNDPTTDLTGIEWTSPDTGKTYTLDGTFQDGSIQINNTTWSQSAENPDSIEGETFYYNTWESFRSSEPTEIEQDWRTFTGAENVQDYLDAQKYSIIPGVNYSATPRSTELDLTWTQVTTAVKQYSWQAMYAKDDAEFDSIWNELVSLCDTYGYADCLAWGQNEAAIKYQLQVDAGYSPAK